MGLVCSKAQAIHCAQRLHGSASLSWRVETSCGSLSPHLEPRVEFTRDNRADGPDRSAVRPRSPEASARAPAPSGRRCFLGGHRHRQWTPGPLQDQPGGDHRGHCRDPRRCRRREPARGVPGLPRPVRGHPRVSLSGARMPRGAGDRDTAEKRSRHAGAVSRRASRLRVHAMSCGASWGCAAAGLHPRHDPGAGSPGMPSLPLRVGRTITCPHRFRPMRRVPRGKLARRKGSSRSGLRLWLRRVPQGTREPKPPCRGRRVYGLPRHLNLATPRSPPDTHQEALIAPHRAGSSSASVRLARQRLFILRPRSRRERPTDKRKPRRARHASERGHAPNSRSWGHREQPRRAPHRGQAAPERSAA